MLIWWQFHTSVSCLNEHLNHFYVKLWRRSYRSDLKSFCTLSTQVWADCRQINLRENREQTSVTRSVTFTDEVSCFIFHIWKMSDSTGLCLLSASKYSWVSVASHPQVVIEGSLNKEFSRVVRFSFKRCLLICAVVTCSTCDTVHFWEKPPWTAAAQWSWRSDWQIYYSNKTKLSKSQTGFTRQSDRWSSAILHSRESFYTPSSFWQKKKFLSAAVQVWCVSCRRTCVRSRVTSCSSSRRLWRSEGCSPGCSTLTPTHTHTHTHN